MTGAPHILRGEGCWRAAQGSGVAPRAVLSHSGPGKHRLPPSGPAGQAGGARHPEVTQASSSVRELAGGSGWEQPGLCSLEHVKLRVWPPT